MEVNDPPVWRNKVSCEVYGDFLRRWGEGTFKGQRFGQAFTNFTHQPVSDLESDLYFTTEVKDAKALIEKYFLED